ncbi:heparinase II/III family protein [Roseomonas sp. CECT 9278]|uniref:heparinase II/III family protein n=1 Tax=Roseomonas sp. CECT 9278 TaxID=2845823 RepID=UPI001EF9BEA8|nr:heparinase II/III family protein [Roseomonas sp. CECT 9278]CAH0296941.1 FtsZ-localized protein C [Roseomonas sp. CECT 9278]
MINILRGARQKLARLRPVRVPDAPARAFRDLWPGDAARGARLLRGEFETAGTARPLRIGLAGAEGWDAPSGSVVWRAAAHGFAWMRDLRALGTDAARLQARALTADWLTRGAEEAVADAPEVMGARLSAWLGHWDFFAATAEDQFRRAVMTRMAQDARDLSAALPAEAEHRGALAALKGAMAAAIALEEDAYLQRAARFLPAEIERQFHPDGGHVERSPAMQLLALQDLIEIRNLMHGAGVEPPPHLAALLDRAAPALRLFRHGDGGLALFNGTRDESSALIDLVLTQGQARGRAPLDLPESGFQRLQAGRTLIIADTGAPPTGRAASGGDGGLPAGADRFAHAGTLSFEMSVGRDRLIVNCGAAPAAEEAWRDALRATAAHSTVILSDTNSAELRPEGLGRRPEQVETARHEMAGAQWLEASHDGWRRAFGALHRRRLYLAESGDDLRGEDMVEVGGDAAVPSFTLRFHLHPGVVASLLQDESAALLRLPSGVGWKLRAKFARVSLEESVYIGGEPRRAQQVVLVAEEGEASVQWAITRVSMAGAGEG